MGIPRHDLWPASLPHESNSRPTVDETSSIPSVERCRRSQGSACFPRCPCGVYRGPSPSGFVFVRSGVHPWPLSRRDSSPATRKPAWTPLPPGLSPLSCTRTPPPTGSPGNPSSPRVTRYESGREPGGIHRPEQLSDDETARVLSNFVSERWSENLCAECLPTGQGAPPFIFGRRTPLHPDAWRNRHRPRSGDQPP